MQEGYHTRHDSNEGFSQREWNVSYILEQSRRSDWEWELKSLQMQVKDLEIELRGLLNIVKEGHQTRHDLDKGSSQRERIVLYILEQSRLNDWERELENLQKQVKDLEIELRGQRRRRD